MRFTHFLWTKKFKIRIPPPWLIAMQRYGPPPSYPNLKIPGLNAPIPDGSSFGYHAGGWGKPPVDEFGRPLYGDVFGLTGNGGDVSSFQRWRTKNQRFNAWHSLSTRRFYLFIKILSLFTNLPLIDDITRRGGWSYLMGRAGVWRRRRRGWRQRGRRRRGRRRSHWSVRLGHSCRRTCHSFWILICSCWSRNTRHDRASKEKDWSRNGKVRTLLQLFAALDYCCTIFLFLFISN